MRIFEIKDETLPGKVLGYLIYYETSKTFYAELPEGADRWETPLLFSGFVEKGIYSIDSYWSHRFVEDRIVPRDRQNIGQILRDNGLYVYDEFSLLLLAMGRCPQDDCYLNEIPAYPLPELLQHRWKTRLKDIVPLEAPRLLAFFVDGSAKVIDLSEQAPPLCRPYLNRQELFERVEMQPGGYGVIWNERAAIPYHTLYSHGVTVPLCPEDLHRYLRTRVVSAREACRLLECSRQNIDDLIRRGKLHPLEMDTRNKFFNRTEVIQRRPKTE